MCTTPSGYRTTERSTLLGGGVAPATDSEYLAGRGSLSRGATPVADAEGDCSLGLVPSFSFSLLLVSSSIALEDRPAQRDRCASAAAPPLLRLRCCASLRLSRLLLASLAPSLGVFQRHAFDQVVLVFGRRRPGRSTACRLLSAVARMQRSVGRSTARGPCGSHLAPADPDRGEKMRAALSG